MRVELNESRIKMHGVQKGFCSSLSKIKTTPFKIISIFVLPTPKNNFNVFIFSYIIWPYLQKLEQGMKSRSGFSPKRKLSKKMDSGKAWETAAHSNLVNEKIQLKRLKDPKRTHNTQKYVLSLLGTHKVLKCMDTKKCPGNWSESDSELAKWLKTCWEKLQRYWLEYIIKNVLLWMCLGICFICLVLSKLVISYKNSEEGYQKSQLSSQ